MAVIYQSKIFFFFFYTSLFCPKQPASAVTHSYQACSCITAQIQLKYVEKA